jgi:hypothetical protein
LRFSTHIFLKSYLFKFEFSSPQSLNVGRLSLHSDFADDVIM